MPYEFRRERYSTTDLNIHLICVTKYRQPVFTVAGLEIVEKVFKSGSLENGEQPQGGF